MLDTIPDPELPIVDAHQHLWDRRAHPAAPADGHPFMIAIQPAPLYLLDELRADAADGHNVVGTVFLECGSFYRASGPVEMQPVGETEFVNGIAAMSASGLYGDFRACAGIVGKADLLLGKAVKPVLEAHLAAGGGRFRGVRNGASYDPDPNVLGPLVRAAPGLYGAPNFATGSVN